MKMIKFKVKNGKKFVYSESKEELYRFLDDVVVPKYLNMSTEYVRTQTANGKQYYYAYFYGKLFDLVDEDIVNNYNQVTE